MRTITETNITEKRLRKEKKWINNETNEKKLKKD